MPDNHSHLQLLALCTQLENSSDLTNQLKKAAAQITSWENIPALAEKHGVAPLLYFHLKTLPEEVPDSVLRCLKGQALRDRLVNQVRSRQMASLAACFEQAEITLVFLKGAALAHCLYPEPGLRPMSDLDILVNPSDLEPARELLLNIGYQSGLWPHIPGKSRHLPAFYQVADGFSINIELHYALFQDANGHPWFEMQNLTAPPMPFTISSDAHALMLPHEEMLFHLCHHTFFNNNGFDSLRLMWVADIVNYVNHFTDAIDWSKIKRLYPSVLHALEMLHALSPLSSAVINQSGLCLLPPINGVGIDFQGWPVLPMSEWKRRGYGRVVFDTFFPSPWWLHLHYGEANNQTSLWYHWLRHCLNLLTESSRRKIPHD